MSNPEPSPNGLPKEEKFSRWNLAVLVLAVLSLLVTLGYSVTLVRHLAKLTEKVIQPALELQSQAAVTHLWTEETITGDSQFTPEAIDRRYAQFSRDLDIVAAALHDQRIRLWLRNEAILEQMLAEVKSKNAKSREIAAKRLAAPGDSRPGTPSDDQQDAAYEQLSQELARFSGTTNRLFSDHYHMVFGILVGMIALTTVLGLWVGYILVRYRARRRRDIALLQKNNLHLQAVNQQLAATEQQLRANNQQLMATEQQLRASNQQLTATEQQLRQGNALLEANQQVLAEKERRYRNLINNMAEGVAIHRLECAAEQVPANYRILEVNPQYEAILGLRREEVVGRLATEVYHVDQPPFLEEFAAVAMGAPPRRLEAEFAPIGRYFTISVSSFEPGVFVTVFSDITERKRAEEAIRLNEARLKSLLEITQHHAGTVQQLYAEALLKALDLTGSKLGRLYFVDPQSDRLGVEAEAGEQPLEAGLAPLLAAPDSAAFENFPETIRENGVPLIQEFGVGDNHQPGNLDRAGRWQVLGIPFVSAETVHAVVVFAGKREVYDDADIRQATLLMDAVLRIAELRRADEEKNRLALRMQKLESLGVLAGGIAHDFNNMLAGILGNINLVGLELGDREELRSCLHEAEKAAERAKGLTQQLLTFARGGAPLRKVVALPDLLVETGTFAARGSQAQCVFDLAEDLWAAEIDPGQIGQVINNLVINAVQAMPSGGPIEIAAGNIDVDSASGAPVSPGQYIRLTVRDRGVGIDLEYIEKIFDPYFTTKEQGSGLGLAASHAIVRNHQGAILVASKPGEGTLFTLYLPAAGVQPEANPGESQPVGKGQGRILVMDDEPSLRDLLLRILNISGYEAVVTADGTEAVEAYQQALASGAAFDAVILDLTVAGGMGGRETLEKLRAIDPQVVAIVSSGYSKDPVMANYRSYGFAGVACKPYTVQDLQAELHRVLRRPSAMAGS